MSTNWRAMQTNLERYHRRTIPERGAEEVRAVGLAALSGVVELTRVDTGRARGNWQVQEGRPATGFDEEVGDTDGREGPDAPSRRRDTLEEGRREIDQASGRRPIWLHNGLPYAKALNDGSPTNEADRMVERTADRLRRRGGSR